MKQKVFKEKYHIFEIEYKKSELQYKSVDEIIAALQVKIDAHPVIAFIAILLKQFLMQMDICKGQTLG